MPHAMQPITLHSHVGSDGVLQLQLPDELKNQDVAVIVLPEGQFCDRVKGDRPSSDKWTND